MPDVGIPILFPLSAPMCEFYANGRGVWFGWTTDHLQLTRANMVRSRVLQQFPRSEQGWQQCWGVILNQHPALAVELRRRLAQDEPSRQQRAADLAATEELRDVKIYGRIERCTVLGGFGFPAEQLQEGMACVLQFTAEELWVQPEYGARSLARWRYRDLTAVEFQLAAKMRQSTGTLLFEALTLGPMGAMLLNQLGIGANHTAVRVTASDLELFFVTTTAAPTVLQARFAEPLAVIAQAGSSVADASYTAPDVASQLKELALLHERGALTDQQFEAAKSRVIGL